MNKMREAFKQFCQTETAGPTGNYEFDLFSAGYQAAIADVKAGGNQACSLSITFGKTCQCKNLNLYKLPEDV